MTAMNHHRCHIAFLADHPDAVPVVAAWLHQKWFRNLDLSPSETEEKVRSWLSREEIPLALLALVDSVPVGVVSIIEDDDPLSPEPAYCLNGLYVVAPWRRRGIGGMLCRRALVEARRLGLPALSLYTRDAEFYYQGLGWKKVVDTVIESGPGIELVAFMRPSDATSLADCVQNER